jgi:hypothetical protein
MDKYTTTNDVGIGITGTSGGIAFSTDCCASRQSGKAAIKGIIHRLRRKADNLQSLVNMLPEQPTAEQDQQLWEIACDMERR